MNDPMFRWISKLVRDKPDQTSDRPLSQIALRVQAHYRCGDIRNNRLFFSVQDKQNLRRRVVEELSLDPFIVEQLPDSRLEMAQYHPNEKLAAKPAGDDHLLLSSADGVIRINDVQIPLHPGSISQAGLLCLNSGIRTVEHQTIVVIENLAIMPLCHSWRLPVPDEQALWVYRGDHKSGAKAQACRDFIERFGADKTVIVFSDMDPKGLEIALTMPHADYWLGPEQASWRACLQSKQANREGFDLQSRAMTYLERLAGQGMLEGTLHELLLCFNEERSSFRQEHMFNRQVGLALFSLALRKPV